MSCGFCDWSVSMRFIMILYRFANFPGSRMKHDQFVSSSTQGFR
jgi:hypothetical protein